MIASTTEPHWTPRPVLAFGVRVVQYGLPLLAGSVAVTILAPMLVGLVPHLAVVGLSLAVAVVVSLFVSHLTMRLGPLAVLLKMTMIFPDHAPTRLKVARRSTSADEIRRRLTSGRTDEHEAAITMLSLVTALGRHDRHTRGHSERVRLFCDLLSHELGLSEEDAGRLRWAALIHDVGKLEVAVTVLNKPGRLNVREWAQIRMHPQAGARLARPLAPWLGPWFAGIAEHHERFDGTGYPLGLSGDQISLAGRAVAVVDAYETMTAARSYKAAVSAVAARAELTRCAGTHFDPAMVRAFLGIALPRLLWSVGPLAFFVNLPVLRWVGDGGARLAQASSTAVNVAGVSAVVVASGALPAAAADSAPSAAKPGVHKVNKKPSEHGTKKSGGKVAGSSAASGDRGPASTSSSQKTAPTAPPAPTGGATAPNPPPPAPPGAAPTGPASPVNVPLPAGPGAPPPPPAPPGAPPPSAPPPPSATGKPSPTATATDDGHHRHKKKKPRKGKGKGGRESGHDG